MLPFLVDLEREFDAGLERDYDPTELVRYAIGASDYWADLTLGWLDQGVPPQPLVTELEQLEADKSPTTEPATPSAPPCESQPDKRTDIAAIRAGRLPPRRTTRAARLPVRSRIPGGLPARLTRNRQAPDGCAALRLSAHRRPATVIAPSAVIIATPNHPAACIDESAPSTAVVQKSDMMMPSTVKITATPGTPVGSRCRLATRSGNPRNGRT